MKIILKLSSNTLLICFSDNTYEPRHDKTNEVSVRPAKTQISLAIRPVWSVLLCAQWVAKDPSFLHTDSEDSDQTGWMPRLIWVFAGNTTTLLVLSWGGSIICLKHLQNTHFLKGSHEDNYLFDKNVKHIILSSFMFAYAVLRCRPRCLCSFPIWASSWDYGTFRPP